MEKSNNEGDGRDEVHEEQSDLTTDARAPWPPGRIVYSDQETSSGFICPGQTEDVEEDRDAASATLLSFMDTCSVFIPSFPTHPHPSLSSSSSSSSSGLCLSPPLPPSVELTSVLADTRLTLDVYRGGAAALPLLWASIPEQLMGVQYLTLGSDDKGGLDDALDVIPHLTDLHTLTVRGTVMKRPNAYLCFKKKPLKTYFLLRSKMQICANSYYVGAHMILHLLSNSRTPFL